MRATTIRKLSRRRPRKSSGVASMRWCPATRRTSSSSANRFGSSLKRESCGAPTATRSSARSSPAAIYAELSDVAGKSAEMAGRLAGVLTLYDKPGATTVIEKVMRDAITLARWYLNEALRITETGMLRPEIVDAIELLKWLRANPQHRSRSGVLLYGPNRLRSKLSLEPILRILADHNLIVLPKRGAIHVRD